MRLIGREFKRHPFVIPAPASSPGVYVLIFSIACAQFLVGFASILRLEVDADQKRCIVDVTNVFGIRE
jgi:hypothetical protein